MDVCLVNPPTTRDGGGPIYFPMSLLALASFVEREGFHAEVVDYDFEVRTGCFPRKDFVVKAVKDLRKRFPSPIYGLTSVTTNFGVVLLMAEEIKRQMPGANVIVGGPQVSSVARETLERFPFIDAVVVGEGEYTLAEYLEAFKKGEDVFSVPGVLTHKHLSGEASFSKRTLEASLDVFPPADFSKVRLMEYAVFERFNVGYFLPFIEAGRGCPFDCTFCSTAVMWSRKFRVKSPLRIYQELAALKNRYGFASFELIHDNFTTSRKYLHDFCDEFVRINEAGVRWSCASRVDTLHDEDLDLMERAGCDGLFFGVETGSARMQKIIKKDIDLSEYGSLVENCVKRGFRVNAGFILGFPEEEKADMGETIRWVLKSKLRGVTHPSLNRLKALADTEIFRRYSSSLRFLCEDELIGIEDEDCRKLVERHPQLFSSYYLVPHPLFDDREMAELLAFYQANAKAECELLDWVLSRPEMDALKLFHHWWDWKQSQGHGTSSSDRLSFASENFVRFIREELLPTLARQELRGSRIKHSLSPISHSCTN